MAPKKWDGIERRKWPRYQKALLIDMFFKGLKHTSSDETLNISEGGMFVVTNYPAKCGEKVHLKVVLKDKDAFFNAVGQVIWCSDGRTFPKGIGIEFMDLSEEDKDILRKYLKKYKEEPIRS